MSKSQSKTISMNFLLFIDILLTLLYYFHLLSCFLSPLKTIQNITNIKKTLSKTLHYVPLLIFKKTVSLVIDFKWARW